MTPATVRACKAMAGEAENIKLLSENRQARHDYILLERFEAGLALTGTEVKAARAGMVQLKDAYAQVRDNEAWLVNAHISTYSHGNRQNHDPLRDRKLLLHRREIDKLLGRTRGGGLTIIPLRLYLKKGLIKCELALARARKTADKRAREREREKEAEARQALREARRRSGI